MEKTANLKVIFDTEHPDQLLDFLQNNQTPAIHAYADQVDHKAFVTTTFHTTDIEKTMTELADYPGAFIKRAFCDDDTQSQEENDNAKSWIATTIINQFENRHDNISYYGRYQSQPVSSVSNYLESKDFKNGIFATQYEDKLLCDLYGQTGEKTYLFEGQVSENTRLITENQLEQIESSQPTDLYYDALKKPAKISQEPKTFSPNRFNTYFEEK